MSGQFSLADPVDRPSPRIDHNHSFPQIRPRPWGADTQVLEMPLRRSGRHNKERGKAMDDFGPWDD